MEGSILLHRQLLESAVFASEKRLKIWVWILLKASYKERHIPIKIGNGESIITIKRGELLFGRFKAEESLNIDGSTIYKILKWMESENMITIKSNSHYTILTISNFDTFQHFESEKVTNIEQPSNNQVTTIEQPSNTYNKVKKVKQVKKEYIIPIIFDIEKYFLENGYSQESANKFYNYYSVANWQDSKGNKVINWKQKAQAVWFKPENKIIKSNPNYKPVDESKNPTR